jgi:membrane protein YdbS with pleckstrin-like domain
MPTRVQAFKEELEQLVFFTLKLVLHWLALVVILVFVLVGFWLHHLFRRAYVIIEQQQTVEAQDGKKFTRKTVTPDPNQGRTRKNRARRSARKR